MKKSWINYLSDDKCKEFVNANHSLYMSEGISVSRSSNFDGIILSFTENGQAEKLLLDDYGVGTDVDPYKNIVFFQFMRELTKGKTVKGLTYEQSFIDEYKRRIIELRNYSIEYYSDTFIGSERAHYIEGAFDEYEKNMSYLFKFINENNINVNDEDLLNESESELNY